MKEAKKSPATAGILVDPSIPAGPKQTYISQSTTTGLPVGPEIDNPLGYDHYKSPNVLVVPNSKPKTVYLPASGGVSSTTPQPPIYVTPNINYLPASSPRPEPAHIPSHSLETPYSNNDDDRFSRPIAVYAPSSTPSSSLFSDYGNPIAAYEPTTYRPGFVSLISSTSKPSYAHETSTLSPTAVEQINNELDTSYNYNGPSSTYHSTIPSSTERPYYEHDISNSVDAQQPLFNRNSYRGRQPAAGYSSYSGENNNNQIGYDPQYPYYDGVSDTSNGFRYFLPRQYHEEDNSNPERRAGSFGYIDPFGIRRVVYYKTSPEGGFVHRKNNRYVGFNATPYDPRPEFK